MRKIYTYFPGRAKQDKIRGRRNPYKKKQTFSMQEELWRFVQRELRRGKIFRTPEYLPVGDAGKLSLHIFEKLNNFFVNESVVFFLLFLSIMLFTCQVLAQDNNNHTPSYNQSSNATLTVDAYVLPESTQVSPYTAKLIDWHGDARTANSGSTNRVQFFNLPTPVHEDPSTVPDEISLNQNYPNPFNPTTNIEFDIAKSANVKLEVYDINGRKIKTLVDGELQAGTYQAIWAGENENGDPTANGIYIYRLTAGDYQQVKKMVNLGAGGGKSSFHQLGSSELEKRIAENGNSPETTQFAKTTSAPYTLIILPADTLVRPDTMNFVLDADTLINAYLKQNARFLSFNFQDYFLDQTVDSVYVKTSLDSGLALPGRKFKAGLGEEKILANGPRHLRSGIYLTPGNVDTAIFHWLCNADTANSGLDTTYFKGLVTPYPQGFRRPELPREKYVAMTEESIKDTIWIYGNIPPLSLGFKRVDQLNAIAKFFNVTAKELTTTKNQPNGLFGIENKIIAIADSTFNKPDSIANFAYSNMVVVPQNIAPLDLETRKNYIILLAQNITGSNGTYFNLDGVTIKGGVITLNKDFSSYETDIIINEEASSMFLGGVESNIFYPSIYDKYSSQGMFWQQDILRQKWKILRGPGRQFPDLPKEFFTGLEK